MVTEALRRGGQRTLLPRLFRFGSLDAGAKFNAVTGVSQQALSHVNFNGEGGVESVKPSNEFKKFLAPVGGSPRIFRRFCKHPVRTVTRRPISPMCFEFLHTGHVLAWKRRRRGGSTNKCFVDSSDAVVQAHQSTASCVEVAQKQVRLVGSGLEFRTQSMDRPAFRFTRLDRGKAVVL